ncbi:MAG: pseudouridine synthase, partial [Duncaniella sp.]|nr:pseudouridine synthase [Duncaniella sp.]
MDSNEKKSKRPRIGARPIPADGGDVRPAPQSAAPAEEGGNAATEQNAYRPGGYQPRQGGYQPRQGGYQPRPYNNQVGYQPRQQGGYG